MLKTIVTAGAFALAATALHATPVDFEGTLGGGQNSLHVGTNYSLGGINFEAGPNDDHLQLVRVGGGGGNPTDGFVPNDQPQPLGVFGTTFLTGDFIGGGDTGLTMTFDEGDIGGISFQIADIDGRGGNGQDVETFSVKAFLDGALVGSLTRFSGDVAGPGEDPTGDANAVGFSFADLRLDTIVINGSTPGNNRNIGWGLDNIEVAPVPLPAGGLLLLAGIGGLAVMRRRRKAA